jgi:putative peptidoglycan lipid II flippase
MVRGFRQIALLTAISRVLGFVRDTAYGIVFGPGTLLDAWNIAFKVPNLGRRLFGEGAASSSFIPVYSEQLHISPDSAARLANTVITALLLVLTGLVLLGEVVIWVLHQFVIHSNESRLALKLTSITLPYMILICMVAVIAGLLNVHKHFATPALAPVIMNICIIAGAFGAAWFFPIKTGSNTDNLSYSIDEPAIKQLFTLAVAIIIAGLLEFAVQLPALRKSGVTLSFAWEIYSQPFRKIIIFMAPMVIGLSVTQINTLADDLIAWFFSGSSEKGTFFLFLGHQIKYPLWRGSVSCLNFAQHLYQLPLGIFGISLATALFPVMSQHAARKDYKGLCNMISLGMRGSIFIAMPCTIGLIIIARPFISVWLRHGNFSAGDVPNVTWPLMFYSLGISGYFMQHIIVRAFYSLQDSKAPLYTGILTVVVNLTLNIVLVFSLKTGGLALSTAICSYIQVIILTILLHKRLGNNLMKGFGSTLLKTTIACGIMTAVAGIIWYLFRNFPTKAQFDILRVVTIVPSTAVTYLLASKLLRIEELKLLTERMKI